VPHRRHARVAAAGWVRTGGGRNRYPVTSATVLIGWRAVPRAQVGDIPRRGVLALGCVAAVIMGIVGCTTVTNGTATPDTRVAPAYRQSVSASVSASSVTSRVRESQRQQSLTAKAVHASCDTLANTSSAAIDKVNAFVSAYNQGHSTGPMEGPAIDALNDSATQVSSSFSDALSQELKDAFNAYADAAHGVANAIGTHAGTGEFNQRVDQLNDTKTKALKLCLGSF
jgi:hypothetical protein